jgi:hypothetical protein
MTINPYQTTLGQVATSNQKNAWELGCFYLFVGPFLLNLCLLIVSAAYHRSLFEDVSIYTSSDVIRLELISLAISILAMPFLFVAAVIGLILSRFSYAVWFIVLLIATWVSIGIAFLVDAPTLVYRT